MPTQSSDTAAVRALLTEIRAHRGELTDGGFAADRDNADPAANLTLLAGIGAARLVVPAAYGGLWDGTENGGWGAIIRAVREISAGDGPTGQNWLTTALVTRELLGPDGGLPESTRADLARRILDGLRFVSSAAETGVDGGTTARRVAGGVVLSGTKSFNSNSGGLGTALVRCRLVAGETGETGETGAAQEAGTSGAQTTLHHVLVDLTDPGVRLHDDWDTMGQRGTRSQTVTYRDVFVPDGRHQPAPEQPSPVFLGGVMLLHAALLQGIGEGALGALTQHTRTMKRGSLPRFATPAEDPLILRRVGAHSSRLAASRALLHQAADRLEAGGDGDGGAGGPDGPVSGAASGPASGADDDVVADCFRAKIAAADAALDAAAGIHEVTGARSTANAYRYDRYWRNARTFASHDPLDAKCVYVGGYELDGSLPPLSTVVRV